MLFGTECVKMLGQHMIDDWEFQHVLPFGGLVWVSRFQVLDFHGRFLLKERSQL